MTKKQTYLLALFSAFLMWLAWPPIPYTAVILLFGLVPLFIAIENIKVSNPNKIGKRIFLTAGLTFLVWNTASIYWVYNAIIAYNNAVIAFFVSLIPFGLGALLMTFAFWLWYQLKRRTSNKILAYAGLITFYISTEFLHESWDLAFPWMNLGNGFATQHQLVQWYEFTGVYGGTLWILLSNILAFEVYQTFKNKKPKMLKLTAWLAIVIIPIGFSFYIYSKYQEKPMPVNVVVVQPNINPYQKYDTGTGSFLTANDQLQILTKLSDSLGQVNTEYFIWPETAIPNYADEDRIRSNSDYIQAQQFLNKYKNASLITGIESVKFYNNKQTISAKESQNGGFYDNYNSAVQVDNSANVQFYHKSKLVPGAEKLPFPKVFSFLAPVFDQLGGSVSGWGWQEKPGVFYSQIGIGVAPVICYESIWGSWVADAVNNGAQFIAIITNDGWWGNTSGKDQHILYAKLRAIENRRYIARAANTGISGFINQRGDVIQQSKWWTRTALKANINLNDELTFYTKNGDLIAQVSTVIAILLALIIPFKKWQRKKA